MKKGKTKTEPKPAPIPIYESTLVGTLVSLVATIGLTVLPTMFPDVRWLLFVAIPFLVLLWWYVLRRFISRKSLRMSTAVWSIIVVVGMSLIYRLNGAPTETAQSPVQSRQIITKNDRPQLTIPYVSPAFPPTGNDYIDKKGITVAPGAKNVNIHDNNLARGITVVPNAPETENLKADDLRLKDNRAGSHVLENAGKIGHVDMEGNLAPAQPNTGILKNQASGSIDDVKMSHNRLLSNTETRNDMTAGDRDRLSSLLYDFAMILGDMEHLGQSANLQIEQIGAETHNGTIVNDYDNRITALRQISSDAKVAAHTFLLKREDQKWRFYDKQMSQVVGDNPDNLGPNSIINGTDELASSLEQWSRLQDRQRPSALSLLEAPQNEANSYMRTFFIWASGCDARLNELKNSLQ